MSKTLTRHPQTSAKATQRPSATATLTALANISAAVLLVGKRSVYQDSASANQAIARLEANAWKTFPRRTCYNAPRELGGRAAGSGTATSTEDQLGVFKESAYVRQAARLPAPVSELL